MGSIRFENIHKSYDEGEIVAVEDFSLEIADGEFLTIVGPSGSGKSTLLRMVAGLEDVTSGELEIADRPIIDTSPQDRDVAMIFQNYALYPHMTVRENMAYGLRLSTDYGEAEITERVEETAALLDISDLLEKKPKNLSGGQQQRVATGRAIVRDPAAFLMDEPLSNLDAKLRTHMRTELQRLQSDLATTTLYVTHDQEEAMTMSDRIAILAEGVLQQVGTPEEVFETPVNRFVAEFIGSPSMNFFDVRVDGDRLVNESFEYLAPSVVSQLEVGESRDLTLGVRPERIAIADEPGPESIPATILVREPIGSDNYLYVTIGDQKCTMRVPKETKPEEGEQIQVEFEPADVHVFDRETGANLLVDAENNRAKRRLIDAAK